MMKYGMKLLIHSQTSMVEPLKFEKGQVISFYSLLGMWLLIHVGLLVKGGPGGQIDNLLIPGYSL